MWACFSMCPSGTKWKLTMQGCMLTKHRRDLPRKVRDPMSRNRMSRLFPEQKQRLLPDCTVSEGVWLYAGARTKAMLQKSEDMQNGGGVDGDKPDICCSHGSNFWGLASQQQQLLCSKEDAANWDADEGQNDHCPLPYEANQVIALGTICLLISRT